MIHLKAIAGRIGRGIPTIVDLQPCGRFLMEEFYYAGGLPAVLRRLGEANLTLVQLDDARSALNALPGTELS